MKKKFLCFALIASMVTSSFSASAANSQKKNSAHNAFIVNPITAYTEKNNDFSLASAALLTDISTDITETNIKTVEEIAEEKAELLISYGITSLEYAILDNGEMTLSSSAGYADVSKKKAPTDTTMYGIGSVSKMFTIAAVMQLVDEGKVDLDKPVVTYIPEFKMKDSRYKEITVRMLLNHSSGLMGSTFSNAMLLGTSSTYTHDNFLKILSTEYLKYKPGNSSVYCNDGFFLAEILVEKISGMTFTDYVEKKICNPLGLEHTKTPQSDFDKDMLAKTYYASQNALPYESLNTIGAGGIYSTAEDLCIFGKMFMNNNDLLSNKAKKAMGSHEYLNGFWTTDTKNTTVAYGLGWDSVALPPYRNSGITAYNKGGDTIFHHATMTVLPAYNISIAALGSGGSSAIFELFTNLVLTEYLEQKNIFHAKETEEKTTYEITSLPKEAASYAGIYSSVFVDEMLVTVKDNAIHITIGAQTLIYYYTTAGVYIDSTQASFIKFVDHNNTTYIECTESGTLQGFGSYTTTTFLGVKVSANPLTPSVKAVWEKRNGKNYYKDKAVVTNYYMDKNKTVTLPDGGMILFIGNQNAKFTVTMKEIQ